MTTEQLVDNRDYVNRGVEVSTHVGLVILLVAACFLFLRPFLPLITWGIIIAISVYPSYRKLQVALRDRGVLSSVVIMGVSKPSQHTSRTEPRSSHHPLPASKPGL